MGYRKGRRVYCITYEDHEGLEVRAHSAPVGFFSKVMSLAELDGKSSINLTAEDIKSVDDVFDGFVKHLIAWNLEDEDGAPVPCTREGLDTLELPFALELIQGWMEGTMGVSAPLGDASSSGRPSLEASLPMEPLSTSRVS